MFYQICLTSGTKIPRTDVAEDMYLVVVLTARNITMADAPKNRKRIMAFQKRYNGYGEMKSWLEDLEKRRRGGTENTKTRRNQMRWFSPPPSYFWFRDPLVHIKIRWESGPPAAFEVPTLKVHSHRQGLQFFLAGCLELDGARHFHSDAQGLYNFSSVGDAAEAFGYEFPSFNDKAWP